MSRENKRRDKLVSEGGGEKLTLDERLRLGDRDVHYRYVV